MNTSPKFPIAYAFIWALVMLIGAVLVAAAALLFIGTFLGEGEATGLAALGLLGMSMYAGIEAYFSVRHRGLRSPYINVGISLVCIGLLVLMGFFLYNFQT